MELEVGHVDAGLVAADVVNVITRTSLAAGQPRVAVLADARPENAAVHRQSLPVCIPPSGLGNPGTATISPPLYGDSHQSLIYPTFTIVRDALKNWSLPASW